MQEGSGTRFSLVFLGQLYMFFALFYDLDEIVFVTLAEREVKHSPLSVMSLSCFLWDKIGHAQSVGFLFYSAI